AFVGLRNYIDLLLTEDFRHSLANLVLFTATFLIGALAMGFVWAWLLERPLKGGRLFQTVYLFPMAVSFVASGVVWRWLDRKSTRLNSSHVSTSYAVFCLKKKI